LNEINLSIKCSSFSKEELPEKILLLFNRAKSALKDAYAPYSNFKVAAAVLLENGEIITGTNQENAAYPAGICAEGTAMSACAALYPNIKPVAMFITVQGDKQVKSIAAPCGICRQRLVETEYRYKSKLEIWLGVDSADFIKINSARDLLPLAFTPEDL
jgi:cytidine deaminase